MAISGGHLSTAYGCSAAERIDGALFAACGNDRARQVFYRMDAGIRTIWRGLRGYELNAHVLDDATRANETLLGEVGYVGISREFVAECVRLNRMLFNSVSGSGVSLEEYLSRSASAAGLLDVDLSLPGSVLAFERSCQEVSRQILSDPERTDDRALRNIRTKSGEWALRYQEFLRSGVES